MEQLEIRNLSFSYPDAVRETIADVSFSISKGEYVLLCGNSGCGKTTLLRHLKSVLTPTGSCRGEILYNGVPLEQVDGAKQASAIGYVMQNPDDQIVTDKVWHELAFGLENLGVSRETIGLRVAEMASFFGIQSWYHRDISQLSGGQKQLLNLASIMAMQPEILILDEPTAQLDPIAASDFLNTLKKINQELGITVLITEHRAEDIFPVADRVLVMERGHLAANAGPREIGHSLFDARSPLFPMLPAPMRSFYQCGGTGTAPLTVREGRNWLTDVFGEKKPAVRTLPPLPELPKTEPALHIENVWLRYEKQSPDVLKGLTMTVPSGCLYTIVGGNGVGKSTTLRTICGASKPYRGKIQVFGKETTKYPRGELFRNCLSMLPQDPTNLFVKQNVREELEEMNPDKQARIHAAELCEITHLLDAHPYDLSGGVAPDLLGGQGAAVEAQGAVGGAERLVAHVPDEQIVRAHGGGAVAGGGARSVDVEHDLAAHLIGDGDKGVLQDSQTVLHGRALSGADRRPLELQHVVGVAAEQGEIIIVAVHESIVGVADCGKGAEADFHREGASVDDAAHLLREVLLGGFQCQSFRGEAGFCVCPDGHVVPADQILPDR